MELMTWNTMLISLITYFQNMYSHCDFSQLFTIPEEHPCEDLCFVQPLTTPPSILMCNTEIEGFRHFFPYVTLWSLCTPRHGCIQFRKPREGAPYLSTSGRYSDWPWGTTISKQVGSLTHLNECRMFRISWLEYPRCSISSSFANLYCFRYALGIEMSRRMDSSKLWKDMGKECKYEVFWEVRLGV